MKKKPQKHEAQINKEANKKKRKKRNKKENNSKIIKLLTVAPELVTWDCSLTHVFLASSAHS